MSDLPTRRPGPGDDDFDPKEHDWYGSVWWTKDREFWWDGTQWQPKDFVPASPTTGKVRPPGYRRDFWLGFFGTIAVNVVLLIVLTNIASASSGQVGTIVNLLPWVLNIGGLVVFAIVRPRVAVGMLLAYGIALGLALVAGLFLLVLCFGGGSGVP